jgi:hypothetical protein
MNNFKKESTTKEMDEEVIGELNDLSRTVQPSAELLRTTLKKISAYEVAEKNSDLKITAKSAVLSPFSGMPFSFWKIGIPVVALLLVIGGASFTFVDYSQTPDAPASNSFKNSAMAVPAMSNPNDTSDAALDQDTSVIDSELHSLDSDESGTDQALAYNPST